MPSIRKSSRFRADVSAMRASSANSSHDRRIVLSIVDVWMERAVSRSGGRVSDYMPAGLGLLACFTEGVIVERGLSEWRVCTLSGNSLGEASEWTIRVQKGQKTAEQRRANGENNNERVTRSDDWQQPAAASVRVKKGPRKRRLALALFWSSPPFPASLSPAEIFPRSMHRSGAS
jgi:hypothetical protein